MILAHSAHSDSTPFITNPNIVAWGDNHSGQFGNGTSIGQATPISFTNRGDLYNKTIKTFVAGQDHALALCDDGTVTAWGANFLGQIGDGTTNTSYVPVNIMGKGALTGKTVVQLAAGRNHTLALCSDGTLAAWGDNYFGQLGDGTRNKSLLPLNITDKGVLAGKTVTQIATGSKHSLALCSDGSIAAWGFNSDGQLGNGTTFYDAVPTLPTAVINNGALSGKTVIQLVGGESHTLALCSDGSVLAWGLNAFGQLGNGTTTKQPLPIDITNSGSLSGKTVVRLVAGNYHSSALCSDGTIVVWGDNSVSQCGVDPGSYATVPFQLYGINGKTVTQLTAGGNHSIAICSDGSVIFWGDNLTRNAQPYRPVFITGQGDLSGKTLTHIVAGSSYNLGIATQVKAPRIYADSATNITSTSATLRAVINPNGATTTASFSYGQTTNYGSQSSITLTPNDGFVNQYVTLQLTGLIPGTTYHYTARANNNLGYSTGNDVVFTTPNTDIPQESTNKAILAWGNNSYRQIGDGTNLDKVFPTEITGRGALRGKTVTSLAAGINHSLALCSDGTLVAWGLNAWGQLGYSSSNGTEGVPTAINSSGDLSGKQVVQIVAGGYHNLALCSDGTVLAWGSNEFNQCAPLGNTPQRVPLAINNNGALAGKTVVQLAAGYMHSLALCSDGTIVAWGQNTGGQLGNGSTTYTYNPVSVINSGALSGKTVTQIAAGYQHSLALCSDGTIATWGTGPLGNGSITTQNAPLSIANSGALSGKTVTQVVAGEQHDVALCSDGTLVTWGYNIYGQLGNGSTTSGAQPVAINNNGILNGKTITQIVAGDHHNFALCSDGTIAAWGYDCYSQLGDNSALDKTLPIDITFEGDLAGKRVTAIVGGGAHTLALATVIQAPTVVTLPATEITLTTATLNASINPDGAATTAKFEYGPTSTYGQEQSVTLSPDDGVLDQNVSTLLTGLAPHTTYHFRISATNSFGTITGEDLTFTTPNALPQITNTGLRVLEGSTTTIAPTNLNATDSDADALTFTVTVLPTLGSLKLNGVAIVKNGTFTPADIANGALTYTRTATSSSADVFSFKLSDGYSNIAGQFAIGLYRAPSNLLLSKTSLPEKAGVGAVVGTFSSVDADKGDTFTYTLVAGEGDADNGSFSISGATLKATSSFNVVTKSSYSIRVRSTDAQGLFIEKAFVITITDATKPTVVLITPTINQKLFVGDFTGSAVNGSAADNLGVSAVKVRLSRKRGNVNQYWNGTDFVGLNSTVDASLVGTTSVTWTLGSAVPPADKLDTGLYQIEVFATDAAGNKSSSIVRPFSITTDGTAPTVGLNNPLSNQQVLIPDFTGNFVNGTASDDTVVSSVKVRLARKRNNGNEYWNGISFTTTLATVDATVTGGTAATWVLGNKVPTAGTLDNGTYQIEVYALDTAGNKSASISRSFTLSSDFTAPSVTISTPSTNQLVNINNFGAGTIKGTAEDNKGVVSVKLRFQRTRSGATSYWNGTSFTSTSATVDASVSGTTDATWNLSTPIPASALDAGAYILYATAYDAAGNAKTSASRSFYVTGSVSSTSAISAAAASSANGS